MTTNMARYFLSALIVIGLFTGCKSQGESGETAPKAIAPVTVCNPSRGNIAEYTELSAISSFLVKAVIKSPISGYVEKCSLTPGDRVEKNQLLFQLVTKEASALQNDSIKRSLLSGLVRVNASINGVIATLEHPRGDYIQEGESLCTIVLPESLVFLLDAPFELKNELEGHKTLTLMLTDNEHISCSVSSVLPAMTEASQTLRLVLKPDAIVKFPENLIAKVRLTKNTRNSAQILPKSSILSNELMTDFWVMKMVSDTMAVKIPITAGIRNNDSIEVISPLFLPSDRILTSGNYGLSDTARVRIINKD